MLTNQCSVDCVDHIDREKKAGGRVSLTLRPNSVLLSQLKTLQIQFLHETGESHLPLASSSVASALIDSSSLSQTRRGFVRFWTEQSGQAPPETGDLSETNIPIMYIFMHHVTHFSDILAFQVIHAATLLVFRDLTEYTAGRYEASRSH